MERVFQGRRGITWQRFDALKYLPGLGASIVPDVGKAITLPEDGLGSPDRKEAGPSMIIAFAAARIQNQCIRVTALYRPASVEGQDCLSPSVFW